MQVGRKSNKGRRGSREPTEENGNIRELSTIGSRNKRGDEKYRELDTKGEEQTKEGSRKMLKYGHMGEDWGEALSAAPKGSPTSLARSPGGTVLAPNEVPPPMLGGEVKENPISNLKLPPEGNNTSVSVDVLKDNRFGDHPTTIHGNQRNEESTPWWKRKR